VHYGATMSNTPDGWAFSDSGSLPWQTMGEGVAMKSLGAADGRMIATFQFQPGYVGGVHEHAEPEFSYILEGSLISQGVLMTAGHAYAAQTGTTHDDFRTETGCTLVSVFKIPG
jgi:quercetin dioxygenase-like cupin family protein